MQGTCPQCKVAPVVKTKQFGTFPRCESCLELNKQGRYDRRNEKRKAGYSVHHNSQGTRYLGQSTQVPVLCVFCGEGFERSTKLIGRAVCDKCRPKLREERRDKSLQRVKDQYWKNPTLAREKRLVRTLRSMGVDPAWYEERRGRCGICGSPEPGGKGYWHLDHDHRCCAPKPRSGCVKCVRGLLCHHCNVGLGHFKDDPVRLQAAMKWVQRQAS